MRWVCDLDICTNIIQAESTPEGTKHEEVSTAEVVDEEEQPNDGHQRLDDAEDASGEERGICARDTDRFEDSWRVVVDGVNSGSVLPEEEGATEEETIGDFGVVGEGSKWLPEPESNSSVLVLKSGIDS